MNTSAAPKFQVRLNWKIALFSLLLLPLLIGLGIWQLQRAEEKAAIQNNWRAQQALSPVPFTQLLTQAGSSKDENFRRVSVRGQFDAEHYWLLENRMLDGNLGYEVLMPFVTTAPDGSATVIIVNRGWVPGNAYRDRLPEVHTPAGLLRISGNLARPSDNRFINAVAGQPVRWPDKILEVNLTMLGAQLKAAGYKSALYNRVLRIDAASAGAFRTNWQPINMSPAKHRAYAFQWFSMAFALLILSIFANSNLADVLFKRRKP